MFKAGEVYMIRFAFGDGDQQVKCKVLEVDNHLIKIEGFQSDEEARIVNTASSRFVSAYWVDVSNEPAPVDPDKAFIEGAFAGG